MRYLIIFIQLSSILKLKRITEGNIMETSIYLATVLGWFLVTIGFLLLFRQSVVKLAVEDMLAHRGTLFTMALINVLLGLILVTSHNIWFMGWPVVITALCWLIFVVGLFRLFFPEGAIKWGRCWIDKPAYMIVSGLIDLALGYYLIYRVYFG